MNDRSEYAVLVARLSEDLAEYAEERAGIREHDGGLSRELAECLALLDVLRRDPLAFTGVSLSQVQQGRHWVCVLSCGTTPAHLIDTGSHGLHAVVSDMGGAARLVPFDARSFEHLI